MAVNTSKGLKSIPNYVKNLSKSALYAGGDFIGDVMPATKSFVDTNSSVFKAISNDMRNFKSVTKRIGRQVAQSDMYSSIQKYKTNALEDLKSGKLYNMERKTATDIEASGFGDMFDMSDFDIDFEDNNDDPLGLDAELTRGDLLTVEAVSKSTNSIVGITSNVGSVIAETSIKSAEMITSSQQSIYTMNTINNYKMFGEINNVLNDMSNNIRGLFQYTGNTTEYYNATLKMNEEMNNKLNEMAAYNKELIEMQRNLYKEYDKNKNPEYKENKMDAMFDGTGGLNIQGYLEQVGKNMKDAWSMSMFGSSMNMFGEGSNPLLSLLGSPLEFIPKKAIGTMVSKGLKESMGSLDKTISGFFKSNLLKFSSATKSKSEDNPIFDYLYKIFGVEVGQTGGLKTDKYVKGPVPLDGVMRQSIVEVIPGYLRVIAAAVSGNNERVYNYETGKYEDLEQVKKRRDDIVSNSYAKVDDMSSQVKGIMNESFVFSKDADKMIKGDTDKFFRFLADKGYFFNPRKDSYESMNEMGLNLDSDKSFNIINGILKAMGPNAWQELNSQVLESVEYSKNYFDDVNKKLSESGLSAIENGLSNSSNKNKPLDSFNKSAIDYIRDIRTILLEGIRVFVDGGRGKNNSSKDYEYITNGRLGIYKDSPLSSGSKNILTPDMNTEERAKKEKKLFVQDVIDIDDTKLDSYIMSQYNKIDNTGKPNKLNESVSKVKNNSIFGNIKSIGKNIFEAPALLAKNMMDSVNTNLINFLYGKEGDVDNKKGIFDSINDKIYDMMDRVANWMNDKLLDPLNNLLFNPTNGLGIKLKSLKSKVFGDITDGKSENGFLSPAINAILDAKDHTLNGLYGKEFNSRVTGSKVGKSDITVLGEFKSIASSIKSAFVKDKNSNEPTMMDKMYETLQIQLGGISRTMFGSDTNQLSPKEFYDLNIKDRMGKIGLGSVSGLALSLFTPLGLFGGTLMGGAVGALSTSERFKNKMFGEIGEDGTRKGGTIPKKYIDSVKKASPNIYRGIAIGTLGSLVTPFGLFGSMMLGGGLGFASSTESVKSMLFGKMGKDGTRDDSSALIKKEFADKLKIKLPGMKRGATIGLVSSLFLPGGPVVGSILGLSAGIASQSESVKKFLFGDMDPETDKRQGGFFGKFRLWFQSDIAMPIKDMFGEMRAKGIHWIQKSILNPLLDSFDPLKKQFQLMKDNFMENMKSGFSATKDFVGGMFEKHVGQPFGKLITDNFINPLKTFFKNTFGQLGKAFLGVLASPFTAINKVAMGYKDQHIKDGNADYLDDWTKKKRERDNKTEDDYNNKMKGVKADKRRTSLIQKLFIAGKYDLSHPATIKAMSMMDNGSIKAKSNLKTENPINDINVNSDVIKDNTTKMESSLSYIKNIFSNIFGNFANVKNDTFTSIDSKTKSDKLKTSKFNNDKIKNVKLRSDKSNIINPDGLENPENAKKYKNETMPNIALRIFDKLDSITKIRLKSKNTPKMKNPRSSSKESDGLFGDISDDEGDQRRTNDVSGVKDTKSKNRSFYNNINTISNNSTKIYDEIKGQITNVGYNTELIANILTEQFGAPSMMPKGIRGGIHLIKSKLSSPFKFITELIKSPFKVMGGIISGLVKPVTTVVGEVIKSITAIPRAILGTINELAKGAVSLITNSFKAIPAIINTIATGITETLKIAGAVGVEVVKGIGSAARSVGDALGHLGVGIIKVTSEAIPALFKLTNTIVKTGYDLVKGVFGVAGKLLSMPFRGLMGGKSGKTKFVDIKNIDNIRNIEYLNTINNINTVDTLKSLDKINDERLFLSLDEIKKAVRGKDTNDVLTNQSNVNEKPEVFNIMDDLKAKTVNITDNLKNIIGKKKENKNIDSIDKFNKKEKGIADEQSQKKLNTALIEGANANKATHKLLSNVMDGKKGLFGKLFMLFQFVYNGLKAFRKKMFSFADTILDKFTKGGFVDDIAKGLKNSLFKNGSSEVAEAVTGKVAGEAVENVVKKGAIDATSNLLVENGGEAIVKKGAKSLTGKIAKPVAMEAVENVGKTAVKKGVGNTVKSVALQTIDNAVVSAADPSLYRLYDLVGTGAKAADSSIITKIFSSKAMQKLAGSKIGRFLPKIGQELWEKVIKKGGASLLAKISAKWATVVGTGAISGGLIPAIWYGGTIINGISATNRMFEVSPNYKPSALMRLIAGVSSFITENVTFGLVPDKWICKLIANFVLSEEEQAKIAQGNQELQSEHEAYMAKTGEDITFGDYNKKVANRSLMTKAIDGTKSIGNGLTLNMFNNDKIRSLNGLAEEDPITMGARFRTGAITGASALTLGIVKPEQMATAFESVGKATSKFIDGSKEFFSTLDERFLDVMDTANATIGAIFGLTDEKGEPINFTEWTKIKYDNFTEGVGKAVASVKKKANEIWGSITDEYDKISAGIGKGLDNLNTSMGTMFGLTDKDGNGIKLTEWINNGANSIMEGISTKMKETMTKASEVWDSIGDIYEDIKENVKKGADSLNTGVGNLLGLEDSSGNSTSLTGWVSNKASNVSDWFTSKKDSFTNAVNVRKNRGGRGAFGTSAPSTDTLNGATYYSQYDSRWADQMYLPTETIKQAGCGPTSAAMVISSVTGQSVTPPEIAQYSVEHGHMHPDLGTSWSLFPDLGQKYGIGLNQTNNFDDAANALSQGRPVIFSGQGSEPFTSGGHFVVGVGMTSDGKVIVNDPISSSRSKNYDYNSFISKSKGAWVSSKSLTGGAVASGVNNKTDSTENADSSAVDNPFTTALGQLGTLTTGLVSSAFSNEVFDANAVLFPENNTSTASAGSLSGFNGPSTNMDFDFSSIASIGMSNRNNTTYGKDAIRSTPGGNEAFISALAPQAIKSQEEFGIPASTVIAQGILESGWGKHTIGNNIFGIKEGSGYTGPVVSTKTTENYNGSNVSITDTFRGYNSISEAVYDHAKNVIAGNPQYYSGVINNNWQKSIEGLSPSYATDPNYTSLLKSIVKDNNLTQFNNMSSSNLGGKGGKNLGGRGKGGRGESDTTKLSIKPLNIQANMAESLRYNNEKINNILTAKNISEKSESQSSYDLIVRLLETISDNTGATAQNTSQLLDKDFNINVEQSNKQIDTEDENNVEATPSTNNTRSGFGNILNKKNESGISSAYAKAKQYATGMRN